MQRLETSLKSWRGTPYATGQQVRGKQGAVDCVRFGAAVLDDLYGFRRELPRNIALDACVHAPDEAVAQVSKLLRIYHELDVVHPGEDGLFTVEPADMVIVGPAGGGPGHLMVVGYRPNTLWEAIRPEVSEVGCTLDPDNRSVKHVFRANDRWHWVHGISQDLSQKQNPENSVH